VPRESFFRFEWDDDKSERCLRERDFSFAEVQPAFLDPGFQTEADTRRDYGEPRFRLYGRVDGRLFVIVYTMRGGLVRIISARKANPRERLRYGQGHGSA
jgi:uncharacterized protein